MMNTILQFDFAPYVFMGGSLWLLMIFFASLTNLKKGKIGGFKFTRANYYIFVLPLLILLFLWAYLKNDPSFILIFFIFGIAGVVGETAFSLLWDVFFRKPFWRYTFDPIIGSYSSTLNFIPWAFGGLMYLSLIELWGTYGFLDLSLKNASFLFASFPFVIVFFFMFVFVFFIAVLKRTSGLGIFEFSKVSMPNYFVFVSPMIGAILLISTAFSYSYLIIAVVFGFSAFAAEYLFGKITEFFISKKLWYYNYLTLDKQHTTLLNIVPFAFAGFYFWIVYEFLIRSVH